MSAELWGSRLKLKWVMNRAIFQGITAANAGRASRQKALERHMGKGRGVARGLSLLLSLARLARRALCCLLLSRACCYGRPLDPQAPAKHR